MIPKQQQQQQQAAHDDLLNFGTQSIKKSNETTSTQQQAPQDDLLGDIFGSGVSTQSTPNKPATQQSVASDDLLGDILGSMPATNTNINNVVNNNMMNNNNNNNNSNLDGDIFGSLTSSPTTNVSNIGNMMGGMQTRGFAALKSKLNSQILQFQRSHETDQVLFENEQFQISYFTIFKQQKSSLCLFLSNLSVSIIPSIQISVRADNQMCALQFGFDVSNSFPKPNLRNATTAILSNLAASTTSCQMITFGLTNPVAISIPCNIVLTVNSETIKIALKMSDLIRPSVISTKDFGINWAKLSAGSSVLNVNTSSASIQNYVTAIKHKLHVHHIETIQSEVIAAGNISSITNSNMLLPILIHCKCTQTQSYQVIIRTPNANISKAIGIELQQMLS